MITLILLAPIVLPCLGALGYLTIGWRRETAWLSALTSVLGLVAAIVLAVRITGSGAQTALDGLFRADELSVFVLIVIGSVATLATTATPSYLRTEIEAGRASTRTASRHNLLVQLFLATMAAAVLASNLGMLWVTIEATTILTAFLVGQRRTRQAVEAAWKYVVICSTGIALALLGTLLLNYAFAHAAPEAGLDLARMTAEASELDPSVTRIAVLLLFLGFGTKAGLAPMHAWLPDAHSQAPAPVSALMSGVLLSVAFYAVLRVQVISAEALGPDFARTLLAAMALGSLVVAASLMLAQGDYKRMLAYSSIEHLGLVCLGAAIGGQLALSAVLLHMLGHGLVKAVLFLSAGRILQVTGTSRIDAVRGLATRAPLLAGCFGFGVLALIGLPPFSIFASELGIARAGLGAGTGYALVTVTALLLILVIAGAMVGHTSRMLLGEPSGAPVGDQVRATGGPLRTRPAAELATSEATALVGGLAACALIGIAAGPLSTLLHQAAQIITGTS